MFFHYRLKNEGDLRREMWIWSNCSVWPKHHGWVSVQRLRLWSGGDTMPMPSKRQKETTKYKPSIVLASWWPQILVFPVASVFPLHHQKQTLLYWTRTREKELQHQVYSTLDLKATDQRAGNTLVTAATMNSIHSIPTKCLLCMYALEMFIDLHFKLFNKNILM